MKNNFISVFSDFICTQGSAISRGIKHALQYTESWLFDYNKQRATYWYS